MDWQYCINFCEIPRMTATINRPPTRYNSILSVFPVKLDCPARRLITLRPIKAPIIERTGVNTSEKILKAV